MYKLTDTRGKEFALSFTHEEIFLDLVRKFLTSYQDLPIALYHFSTKFRNEARAKSGILRGREFMMNDLYSLHAKEADFFNFYEKVKTAYQKIFSRIGFKSIITEAAGGVFTKNNTHEFQVICQTGEDLIYLCDKCQYALNKEILPEKSHYCPKCKKGKLGEFRSIEIGNIFPFGTYYSERMHVYFTDQKGLKKPPHFGSYGIGSTRILGTWVEVSHDEQGIIWSKSITPYHAYLIDLTKKSKGEKVYQKLKDLGIEVLFDDRDLSAGEKFANCDLMGIPIRLLVSDKTKDGLEYKTRISPQVNIFSFDNILEKLKEK
jgi:prolyl-tRNA synthetase